MAENLPRMGKDPGPSQRRKLHLRVNMGELSLVEEPLALVGLVAVVCSAAGKVN